MGKVRRRRSKAIRCRPAATPSPVPVPKASVVSSPPPPHSHPLRAGGSTALVIAGPQRPLAERGVQLGPIRRPGTCRATGLVPGGVINPGVQSGVPAPAPAPFPAIQAAKAGREVEPTCPNMPRGKERSGKAS